MSGCGDPAIELNDVSGVVTHRGKPLSNFVINFIPKNGRPGQALTDAAGRFPHVIYNESRNGLLTGEYDVVVQWVAPEPPAGEIPIEPPAPPMDLWPLLEKYGQAAKPAYHVTIEKGQRTLQIDLKE